MIRIAALMTAEACIDRSSDDARHEAMKELLIRGSKALQAYAVMEMEVRTFCNRVEAGEVRSKRTYAAFMDCLNQLEK